MGTPPARPDATPDAEDGQEECPSYISTTNRAATLGDLANAFRILGRFDDAPPQPSRT